MHATEEVWKPVVGTDGRYQVSNLGNVRSVWTCTRHGKCVRKTPMPMAPNTTKDGYRNLTSLVYANGEVKCKGIHVLVMEAFVGPRPSDGHEAAHENGVAGDDRLENLAWKTSKANAADKTVHGTQTRRATQTTEDGIELLQCRKCLHWKPREGFNKLYSKKSLCKLESECKTCRTEYMRHYMYAKAHGITTAEAIAMNRPNRKAA